MMRFAGHVGLCELRPEASGVDELGRGDVIGMGVDPIWREQPPRPLLSEHGGQLRAVFNRGLKRSIWQAKIFAPVEAEYLRGGGSFALAEFRRAVRCGLAARKVQNANPQAFLLELQNRAGHAEFGVVGMRCNDEDIEHDRQARVSSSASDSSE